MITVTLPRKKYETLKKKAALYEQIFERAPKKMFGIELYSDKRVSEFLKTDKVSGKIFARVKQLLKK